MEYEVPLVGQFFSTCSNINISRSRFDGNSAGYGGAIFTQCQSNTTIVNSTFINNTVHAVNGSGSVLYDYQGTVDILNSKLSLNMALGSRGSGGSLYFYRTIAGVMSCSFSNNNAAYGGVQRGLSSTIYYENSAFSFNSAVKWGGVMDNQRGSNITIKSCHFERNSVNVYEGGVVRTTHDIVTIINSTFLFNTANDTDHSSSGGALSGLDSNFTIVSCRFIGNSASYRGGALYTIGSKTMLYILDSPSLSGEDREKRTVFINNYAEHGGAVYSTARSLTVNGSILTSNNPAGDGDVFYIGLTTGEISGTLMHSNNLGSLVLYSSDIVLDVSGEFTNNTNSIALSIYQSIIHFNGSSYRLEHNRGENGGAIYAVESTLYVNAPVRIDNNRAMENGGGIYLYQSEVICGQNCHISLKGNMAREKGGGIFATSSVIKFGKRQQSISTQSKWLRMTENRAKHGGGVYLEANSKLYIQEYSSTYAISFEANRADYGGAMYVDDYTSNGACNRTILSPASTCYLQIQVPQRGPNYHHYLEFFNNFATISGAILYGGLLDRCISNFCAYPYPNRPPSLLPGPLYFKTVTSVADHNLASISSDPVKVCPCVNNQPDQDGNCTNRQHVVMIKKGERFGIPLAAYNQVDHPLNNTAVTITGYLTSLKKSYLVEGQATRLNKPCAEVFLKVFSLLPSERLTLYASDGPCIDVPSSTTKISIIFLPCTCPIGFQPSSEPTTCNCQCHDDIKEYVTCNSRTESIVRLSNSWISYINQTNVQSGYLIYPHCPFDYCYENSVSINLNEPNGEDAQCRFNRTGLLCGTCQPGLSLSLGSSQCLSCPNYWPVFFISITIAAIVAGIVLVIFLLVLNLTVAVGTLNGLIFYANIVAVNRSILLPFSQSNFITIFISWLNLELGIETCYFVGMDAYTKTWLQLVFPAYVIMLVILIIIISHFSLRFSDIIGRRNPVATLATLLLISYAKILQTGITALSYATIVYPDGYKAIVWCPDATINYLTDKHIILFVAGVIILLGSLMYTALVLSWHWLQFCSKWKMLSWVTNSKFRAFIEVYTVPYASTHHYWTGLLLLLRIILYLIPALNFSGNPTLVLASVIFTMGLVLFLKSLIGRVYTKLGVDILETLFFLNILSFALFTWFAIDAHLIQRAIAHVSVVTSFILLLMIVLYHVHLHTKIFSKVLNHVYKRLLIFTEPFRAIVMPKDRTPSPNDDNHDLCPLQEPLLDTLDDSIINTSDRKCKNHLSELTYTEVEAPKHTDSTMQVKGVSVQVEETADV